MMIKLIVGLGNPGDEYAATRHNAGFWWIDTIARKTGITLSKEGRFHGFVARTRIEDKRKGQEVWLLKPQTFMNRSGLSVSAVARFYKILPENILVVHDELDLPPGTVKFKLGGGSGGHNGLKDISAHLSTPNYWRLRLGIGHPRDLVQRNNGNNGKASGPIDVVSFVLAAPRKAEQPLIDDALRRSLLTLPLIGQGEMERAMMQLHR